MNFVIKKEKQGLYFLVLAFNYLYMCVCSFYNKFRAILGDWLAVASSVAEAC